MVLIDAVKTISNQPLDEIIANYKNEGILVTTSDQIWKMKVRVSRPSRY
jgi:hypothetical protein